MLATFPNPQPHRLPMSRHTHSQSRVEAPAPTLGEEDRFCAGCKQSVNSETGGVVVAFGNSLWHVDCFKCAKCGNKVNADTNLLLLSDDSPVCANCYNCKACNLPILDEAVMTGEDSYHAACFVCRTCHKRIDELVFAKTSQGFYCMNCHNERVARARSKSRHAKHQREKERLGSSSGKSPGAGSGRGRAAFANGNGPRSALDSPSGVSRSGNTTPPPSTDSHSHVHTPYTPHTIHSPHTPYTPDNSRLASTPHQQSVLSTPSGSADVDTSLADIMSNESFAESMMASLNTQSSRRAASSRQLASPSLNGSSVSSSDLPNLHNGRPVSPSVHRSSSGPQPNSSSGTNKAEYASRSAHVELQLQEEDVNGSVPSTSAVFSPSIEVAPPPPYSVTPPPDHTSSQPGSARSSQTVFFSTTETGSSSPSLGRERDLEPTTEFGEIRRTSRDDDGRHASSSLSPNSSTSQHNGLGPSGVPLRSKRHSVNPAMRLDASKYQGQPIPSSSSSPIKPSYSGKSSAATGRDSPHLPSPLREQFGTTGRSSVDSIYNERRMSGVSNRTVFYSPSSSPQPPETLADPSPVTTAPSFNGPTSSAVVKPPQRSDSLAGRIAEDARGAAVVAVSTVAEHLAQMSNALGSGAFREKGFGERKQLSPFSNGTSSQESRGSRSRSASWSRSASPKPPDVPESVSSGTDTEMDGEEEVRIANAYSNEDSSDAPPPPPPKEARPVLADRTNGSSENHSRSPTSPLDPKDDARSLSEGSEPSPSHEMSREERRTSFFLAAIPPMRFSMDQTDFSEILKYVSASDSANGLTSVAEGDTADTPTTSEGPSFPSEQQPNHLVTADNQIDSIVTTTPTTPELLTSVDDISNGATPRAKKNLASNHTAPLLNGRKQTNRDPSPPDAVTSERSSSPVSPPSPTSTDSHINLSSATSRHRSGRAADDDATQRSSRDFQRGDSPNLVHRRDNSAATVVRNSTDFLVPPQPRPPIARQESTDIVAYRLKEALTAATQKGNDYVKLDISFINAILKHTERKKEQYLDVSGKLDGLKRTSQQMIDGITVAQEEYDKEQAARREAEAEVTRLKVELSDHAARLTLFSGDEKKRELQQKLSQELIVNLSKLEKDLSKLKVEREMTVIEVEELLATKRNINGAVSRTSISDSLVMRLDNIKRQYQFELAPLAQQREVLIREINELRAARKTFLEETTMLNARNEELAQLNAQYERRLDSAPSTSPDQRMLPTIAPKPVTSFDTIRCRNAVPLTSTVSTSSSVTLHDELSDTPSLKIQRLDSVDSTPAQSRSRGIFGWTGNKAKQENALVLPATQDQQKGKGKLEHIFQQLSVLKFTRCDHCGDKMWGSQLRCTSCNISVHPRCANHVRGPCKHDASKKTDDHMNFMPAPPSMFGRDLIEQVHADSQSGTRLVPVIVEKCIDAVETLAMDYEGIYRKSGGSGQSKNITQLFERGDYDAFDLRNSDSFNDISSVTSVLKNYFRALPDPLLTYALHESFVSAADIRDSQRKNAILGEFISELPKEHYNTLCHLMLHLHRVQLQSDQNLMTARNLGVVFGPTLMRSPDITREFADMAGKALTIEWLIENAPSVFSNYPLQQ